MKFRLHIHRRSVSIGVEINGYALNLSDASQLLDKCLGEADDCIKEATFKRCVVSGVVAVGLDTPLGSSSQTQLTAQAEDQI